MNLLIRMVILYLCVGASMMLIFPDEMSVIKGNPFVGGFLDVTDQNVTIAEELHRTIPAEPEKTGIFTSLWEVTVGSLAMVWGLIALLINLAIYPLNLALGTGLPYAIRLFFGIFGVIFYLTIIFFIRGIGT